MFLVLLKKKKSLFIFKFWGVCVWFSQKNNKRNRSNIRYRYFIHVQMYVFLTFKKLSMIIAYNTSG